MCFDDHREDHAGSEGAFVRLLSRLLGNLCSDFVVEALHVIRTLRGGGSSLRLRRNPFKPVNW